MASSASDGEGGGDASSFSSLSLGCVGDLAAGSGTASALGFASGLAVFCLGRSGATVYVYLLRSERLRLVDRRGLRLRWRESRWRRSDLRGLCPRRLRLELRLCESRRRSRDREREGDRRRRRGMLLSRRRRCLPRLWSSEFHEEELDGLRERRALLEEVRRVERDPSLRCRERERERLRERRGLRERRRFFSACFSCSFSLRICSLSSLSLCSLPSRRYVWLMFFSGSRGLRFWM